MEVGFTAEEAVEKHQGSALSLTVEHVISQADRTEGEKNTFKLRRADKLSIVTDSDDKNNLSIFVFSMVQQRMYHLNRAPQDVVQYYFQINR